MASNIYQRMEEQGLNEIVGGGDAELNGRHNLAAVKHLTLLEPDMQVLDFGCGCGRLAIPTLEYLSDKGSYVGVDIIPSLIKFCVEEIGREHDNADFFLSVEGNNMYDKYKSTIDVGIPKIESLAELGQGRFDVITAFSVFTHLTLEDSNRYLAELKKLLKPGGKICISCFLINESSRDLLQQGKSAIPFGHDVHEDKAIYFAESVEPLTAVGFQEKNLTAMALENGLDASIIYYGQWCGRSRRHSYQDLLVLEDEASLPADFNPKRYLELNPDLPWKPDNDGLFQAECHYLQDGYFENRLWK